MTMVQWVPSENDTSLDSLTRKLSKLAAFLPPEDEAEIELILNGLMLAEAIQSNNTAMTNRINKLPDSVARTALVEINTILREVFKDNHQDYPASPYYVLIKGFWEQRATLRDEATKNGVMTLVDEILKKYLLENEKVRSKILPYSMQSLIDSYHFQDDFHQSFPATLTECAFTIRDEKRRFEALQYIEIAKMGIMVGRYQVLASLLNMYYKYYPQIDDTYYKVIKGFTETAMVELGIYIEICANICPQFVQPLQSCTAEINTMNTRIIFREFCAELAPAEQTLEEKSPADVQNLVNLVFKQRPFAQEELDPFLASYIAPMHQWMYAHVILDVQPKSPYVKNNFNLYMYLAQFDRAMEMGFSDEHIETSQAKKILSTKLGKVDVTFNWIGSLAGVFHTDENLMREINYIHFAMKTIEDLKSLQPEDMPDSEKEMKESGKEKEVLLREKKERFASSEFAMASLWRAAHGDIRPQIIPLNFGAGVEPLYKNFYVLLFRQKYLFMAMEILAQLRRFGFDDFINPIAKNLIQIHCTTPEQKAALALPGTDGIMGLISDAITKIGIQFNFVPSPHVVFPVFIPDQAAIDMAEAAYQELIREQDKELKKLKIKMGKIKEALKEKKKTARTNGANRKKKFPPSITEQVSEQKQEQATKAPRPRSVAATLYSEAGFVRWNENVPIMDRLKACIVIYEKIVAEYDPLAINEKLDYFYIVAAFVELAECYSHMALEETDPTIFEAASGNAGLLKVIKLYRDAVKYAKQARDCCVLPVVRESAESEGDFEALTKNASRVLENVEHKLNYLKSKSREIKQDLKEAQQEIEASGRKAREDMGELAWKNNPKPTHTFRNISEENSKQIKHLESSEKMIQLFIDKGFKEVNEDIRYLAGAAKAHPLLSAVVDEAVEEKAHEEMPLAEKEALRGKGQFYARCGLLASTSKRLRAGEDPRVTRQLLLMGKSALDSQLPSGEALSKALVPWSRGPS